MKTQDQETQKLISNITLFIKDSPAEDMDLLSRAFFQVAYVQSDEKTVDLFQKLYFVLSDAKKLKALEPGEDEQNLINTMIGFLKENPAEDMDLLSRAFFQVSYGEPDEKTVDLFQKIYFVLSDAKKLNALEESNDSVIN